MSPPPIPRPTQPQHVCFDGDERMLLLGYSARQGRLDLWAPAGLSLTADELEALARDLNSAARALRDTEERPAPELAPSSLLRLKNELIGRLARFDERTPRSEVRSTAQQAALLEGTFALRYRLSGDTRNYAISALSQASLLHKAELLGRSARVYQALLHSEPVRGVQEFVRAELEALAKKLPQTTDEVCCEKCGTVTSTAMAQAGTRCPGAFTRQGQALVAGERCGGVLLPREHVEVR